MPKGKGKRKLVVKHRISITTEDDEFARQVYKTIDLYSPKKRDISSSSTCVICGGKLKKIVDVFKGRKLDAYKCQKCGESYLDPSMTEKILQSHKLGAKASKATCHNRAETGKFTSPLCCKKCLDKVKIEVHFVKDADTLGYGMGDWYCPRCGFGELVQRLFEAWQDADVTCRGHVDYERKMKLRLKDSFREIIHGK